MGEPNEIKPGRGVFHENPTSCICENSSANYRGDSSFHNHPRALYQNWKEDSANYATSESSDDQSSEYEQDSPDSEDLDSEYAESRKELTRGSKQDQNSAVTSDQPEFEEWLSD